MKKNDDKDSRISRSQFLKMTAGFAAGVTLSGFVPYRKFGSAPGTIKTNSVVQNLGGDMWSLHEVGSADNIKANVPGDTYNDLINAGRIPDPYFRENNAKVQWVANKDWVYERTFGVSNEILNKDNVQLICHGLDTLSTIWINDQKVANTDNMFRTYVLDVKKYLKKGMNRIQVRFNTLDPFIHKHEMDYKAKYGVDLKGDRSWVRKAPYMWSWDWCRTILTMGIWKEMELIGFNNRISDVGVLQNHKRGEVHLDVDTSTVGSSEQSLQTVARVMFNDKVVDEKKGRLRGNKSTIDFRIKNPKLWWPNGMGEQNLYWVIVELRDADNNVVDTKRQRIGLRKIEVISPKDGVAMHVKVNDVPVFVKGADWIPADNIPARVTPDILRSYMQDAADCHFNFIRLWGGGYYEEDALYDACDELGIMLQFEFKFANAAYPVKDKTWINNLKQEVEDQVLRCRNHPSIVIWSGNNEIKKFDGYYFLFRDVIGGIVHKLVPGAFYEVGSGAAGSGDIHTWGVWHGMKPFESYLDVHGFVTEFGMQSFTVPMTVHEYTDPQDRTGIHSKVMGYHEMSYGPKGINRIEHYMTQNFGRRPQEFDSNLWLSQIMQAYGIRFGVEHWRRDMPHSMAATIWQFNDCWPAPTWSMVDWYHRWKALQFQSRHFFAPILVSGLPDSKTGKVDLYVVSDQQKDERGTLRWTVTNLDGKVVNHGSTSVKVEARTSKVGKQLDLNSEISANGADNLIIWPELEIGGKIVSQNMLIFNRPKSLKLKKPDIKADVSGTGKNYQVTLGSNIPALWVWIDVTDTEAKYSDNFIHLKPGDSKVINVTLDEPMSESEFKQILNVQSVHDVAPDMQA
ncbi:MAG TPA: glycoside hydrolase family 2 protein [Balneolales bacterium]|nr:glycoside hydrolase family 2 protein [Balneolales bacterium]